MLIFLCFVFLLVILQANEKDINELVDIHLAALYPKYLESTRAVLVRQARDLLQTVFHGDLVRFEREFLSPSAEIIKTIKNASHDLSVSFSLISEQYRHTETALCRYLFIFFSSTKHSHTDWFLSSRLNCVR